MRKKLYLVWHQYSKQWCCTAINVLGFHVMQAEGRIIREESFDGDCHPPTLQELGDALAIASTFRAYNDEREQHEH